MTIIVIFAKIMTIMITIIVTIMKIQKIQKVIIVIVVIVAIMITKILVMINSARSYDWSYVLLSQAFLNIIIIIISKWSCSV